MTTIIDSEQTKKRKEKKKGIFANSKAEIFPELQFVTFHTVEWRHLRIAVVTYRNVRTFAVI